MSGKYLVVLALLLGGLGYWMLQPREKPDITETQARTIAHKAFEDLAYNENLRSWAFKEKPADGPPANAAWRWVFQWISDGEPRQQVNILVDPKGANGFEIIPLPPLTEEELAAAAAAATALATSTDAVDVAASSATAEPGPVAAAPNP